jgi:EAL domain-containing protein (putative c-di-GMP-specific phosphodiesterase class I)
VDARLPHHRKAPRVNHQVVFQPIVRLDDWAVLGYEALARFDDGRSPLAHLHDARKAGAIVDFELGLIETALELGRVLPSSHMITVNASAETLVHPGLAEVLKRDTSREWGLELSEMSALDAYDDLRQVVKDLGIVLLIDDAGARYSDLERVAKSAPAIVKVDKSVLHAATDSTPDTSGLKTFRCCCSTATSWARVTSSGTLPRLRSGRPAAPEPHLHS